MEVSTQTKKSGFNKRFYYLLISLLVSLSGFSQNVGINSTGAQPNAAAGLDVDFSNKGLLIPRVALTSTTSYAPLSAHVAGMVVYNTATVSDVTPGFYYDNGIKWMPGFIKGQSVGDMLYWSGTEWLRIPIGVAGQYLQISGSSIPTWGGNVFATLSTTSASAITASAATSGGNITSDGGSSVLSRGICWNTVGAPTIANTKTTDASGTGTFTSSITGLTAGTTYHVRAYAMNSTVINYGSEITFSTLASAPVINPSNSTAAATTITGNSAVTGGNFATDGGSAITQRGVCYATTSNPTISGSKVIDPSTGIGAFVSNLTGLIGGTTYYVRSYATNSVGTTYGTQISFTTSVTAPNLVSVAASTITGTTAVSGGSMSWNGGGYTSYQNYGVAYSTVSNAVSPTFVATNTTSGGVNIATPIAPWTTNITGLTANTTYYIRAFLNLFKSGTGWVTVYGDELSFTTAGASVPVIASTTVISGLSANSANTGGAITSDGGSAITAKGVCWSLSASPTLGVANFTTNGTGSASFTSNLTGLTGNTTYHVRAYATNSAGTSYGPTDVTFTTWVQAPYAVGEFTTFGIVGYVAPDGSGIIVSPSFSPTAPATNFSWGCSGTALTLGTNIGTGRANTDLIIASCGANTAAGIAKAYRGGGATDWYLPSSGEFGAITPIYFSLGLGSNTSYYTSSGYGADNNYASSYFSQGGQIYGSGSPRIGDTYTTQLVAIRNFAPATMPTVTTDAITNVGAGSATGGGNVTSDGGAPILASGVCWSTTISPTIANSKTNDATVIGPFVSNISGLSLATTYYVRAYVTTVAGTAYGSEVNFTTAASASAPSVTTDPVVQTISTEATSGGNVTSDGGDAVTAYGVCWSTTTAPTTGDFTTLDGSGIGTFISSITSLTPGTTYYVRAYATNGIGTAYGNEIIFTPGEPIITTDPIYSLVGTLAEGGGTLVSDGGNAITDWGLCWSETANPTTSSSKVAESMFLSQGSTNFYANMTGLTVGITYHVRAYATNSVATTYGNDVTFTATAATLGQTLGNGNLFGVVYFVDGTGSHGLIAKYNSVGDYDWGCSSSATGATGITVGDGKTNTTAILADIALNGCETIQGWGPGNLAPEVINLNYGPDWHLPSKGELDLLWTNKAIDPTLDTEVTTAASINSFWSSSEVDPTQAWSFDGTNWVNTSLKTDLFTVWPVLSF